MRNKTLVIAIWTLSLLFGVLSGIAWAEPISAGMLAAIMLGGAGISAGGSILGGVLGKGEDYSPEDYLVYKQLPDYPEAESARKLWSSKLTEWGGDPYYGAISPAWDDIWKEAQKKVNQYYWGGITDTGVLGKGQASLARRNVASSSAADMLPLIVGQMAGSDISGLASQESINKATFGEQARKNWLASLTGLAGLKPQFISAAGPISQAYNNYGWGDVMGDVSTSLGSSLGQYGQNAWMEKILKDIYQGKSYETPSSIQDYLGSANLSQYGINPLWATMPK